MQMRYYLAVMLALSSPAFSATYKCQVGGQFIYTDRACEQGAGSELRLENESDKLPGKRLTPEQQLEKEKQKAEALRKERLKRERTEEKAREKAAKQARKDEKKRKARCTSLEKLLAKPSGKRRAKPIDPAKRAEYERECLGRP